MHRSPPTSRPTSSQAKFEATYKATDEIIGHGTYSTVRRVHRWDNNEAYAAKYIDVRQPGFNPEEPHILQSVIHPNIVHCEGVYYSHTHCIIVMKCIEGGELFTVASSPSPMEESDIVWYMYQLLGALRCLHDNGIVHRDVKLENILLDATTKQIQLIDFGFSKKIAHGQRTLTSCCGSPNYMSPEMLRASRSEVPSLPSKWGRYGSEVDMWAAGVVLYVLLFGQYPFFDEKRSKWHKSILQGRYSLPSWRCVTPDILDLLSRLLDVSSETRYTASMAVEHPAFSRLTRGSAIAGLHAAETVPREERRATPRTPRGADRAVVDPSVSMFTPPRNDHTLQSLESTPIKLQPSRGADES